MDKIIDEYVKELLANGIIRKLHLPWRSSIVMIKKPNKTYLICLKYKALNNVTKLDKYPLRYISFIFDELHGAMYFTKLDGKSGYHQVSMEESCIEKAAFTTKNGNYEFVEMPFGLMNAPATF